MSCFWWTASSPFFLWNYQMKKKYHPSTCGVDPFISFGILTHFFWDEPVYQKQLISSVLKLMPNPVGRQTIDLPPSWPSTALTFHWISLLNHKLRPIRDKQAKLKGKCLFRVHSKLRCLHLLSETVKNLSIETDCSGGQV